MALCSQILKASKDCNLIVSLSRMFLYSLLRKQLILVFSYLELPELQQAADVCCFITQH